jgi:hypothetical protein
MKTSSHPVIEPEPKGLCTNRRQPMGRKEKKPRCPICRREMIRHSFGSDKLLVCPLHRPAGRCRECQALTGRSYLEQPTRNDPTLCRTCAEWHERKGIPITLTAQIPT